MDDMKRFTARTARSAAVLVSGLALLVGCGGGGGNGDAQPLGGEEGELAYQSGYQQCTGFSVKDLAATYQADAETPEAVADAVAESTSGTDAFKASVSLGCLDAIAGKPPKEEFPNFDPNATETEGG